MHTETKWSPRDKGLFIVGKHESESELVQETITKPESGKFKLTHFLANTTIICHCIKMLDCKQTMR